MEWTGRERERVGKKCLHASESYDYIYQHTGKSSLRKTGGKWGFIIIYTDLINY